MEAEILASGLGSVAEQVEEKEKSDPIYRWSFSRNYDLSSILSANDVIHNYKAWW